MVATRRKKSRSKATNKPKTKNVTARTAKVVKGGSSSAKRKVNVSKTLKGNKGLKANKNSTAKKSVKTGIKGKAARKNPKVQKINGKSPKGSRTSPRMTKKPQNKTQVAVEKSPRNRSQSPKVVKSPKAKQPGKSKSSKVNSATKRTVSKNTSPRKAPKRVASKSAPKRTKETIVNDDNSSELNEERKLVTSPKRAKTSSPKNNSLRSHGSSPSSSKSPQRARRPAGKKIAEALPEGQRRFFGQRPDTSASEDDDILSDYSEEGGEEMEKVQKKKDELEEEVRMLGMGTRKIENERPPRVFVGPKSATMSIPNRRKTKSGPVRKPRGLNEQDLENVREIINVRQQPSVIVHAATFDPTRRRPRIEWTAGEKRDLMEGVIRFGQSWREILQCQDYHFNPHRTHVDLKDRYRNTMGKRPYACLRKRLYTIVNSDHTAINSEKTGKPFRMQNKWPRDAALKAASRDQFWTHGGSTIAVYVKEEGADDGEAIPPVVHVYQATRVRQLAPQHLRKHNVAIVWAAEVRKIREERLIEAADLPLIELHAESRH